MEEQKENLPNQPPQGASVEEAPNTRDVTGKIGTEGLAKRLEEESKFVVENADAKRKRPVIQVKNLNKEFTIGKNTIRVLKDINVEIYPEEFAMILGPSGCGKSTLLNTVLGLERATSGSVTIDGEELTTKSADELAEFRLNKIGVVYQRADWVRALNVLQNTAFPLALLNVPRKKREEIAMKYLEQLGIADHAQYRPSELSGGQQQRVEIARALTNEPKILVTDEPTGNLDTDSSERVMNIFRTLNKELHVTVIMVTHNLEYVRYASRTVYMRDGKILQGLGQFKEANG